MFAADVKGMRLVVITVLLAACSEGGEPAKLATNRSFTQLVNGPSSRAECEQSGQYFNCLHLLDLCANGVFGLVVTDIIDEGTYTLEGDHVVATQQDAGDGPVTFELTLTDDGFTSPQLAGQHPWVEWQTAEYPDGLVGACN